MKCCAEYRKIMELQEEILETLVTSHDEVHKHLTQALTCLSSDHPAGAAAHIGRCLHILEQSRDDAYAALNDEEDEEDED